MDICGWIVIKSRRGLVDNIEGYYPERAGKGPFSGSLSRFYYVLSSPPQPKLPMVFHRCFRLQPVTMSSANFFESFKLLVTY